jgi:hypothetical protein
MINAAAAAEVAVDALPDVEQLIAKVEDGAKRIRQALEDESRPSRAVPRAKPVMEDAARAAKRGHELDQLTSQMPFADRWGGTQEAVDQGHIEANDKVTHRYLEVSSSGYGRSTTVESKRPSARSTTVESKRPSARPTTVESKRPSARPTTVEAAPQGSSWLVSSAAANAKEARANAARQRGTLSETEEASAEPFDAGERAVVKGRGPRYLLHVQSKIAPEINASKRAHFRTEPSSPHPKAEVAPRPLPPPIAWTVTPAKFGKSLPHRMAANDAFFHNGAAPPRYSEAVAHHHVPPREEATSESKEGLASESDDLVPDSTVDELAGAGWKDAGAELRQAGVGSRGGYDDRLDGSNALDTALGFLAGGVYRALQTGTTAGLRSRRAVDTPGMPEGRFGPRSARLAWAARQFASTALASEPREADDDDDDLELFSNLPMSTRARIQRTMRESQELRREAAEAVELQHRLGHRAAPASETSSAARASDSDTSPRPAHHHDHDDDNEEEEEAHGASSSQDTPLIHQQGFQPESSTDEWTSSSTQ